MKNGGSFHSFLYVYQRVVTMFLGGEHDVIFWGAMISAPWNPSQGHHGSRLNLGSVFQKDGDHLF